MTTELCCWAQRTKLNTWESQAGDQHRTLEETLGDSSHPANIASIARIARTGQQTTSQTQPHSNSRTWWTHCWKQELIWCFFAVVLHVSVGALGPRWSQIICVSWVSFPIGLMGKHFGFNTLAKSREPDEIGRQDVSTQIIKSTTCNVAR